MTGFIQRALRKFDKLTREQARELVDAALGEVETLHGVLGSITQGVIVCDKKNAVLITNKFAQRFLQIDTEADGELVWNATGDKEIGRFLYETLVSGERVHGREFLVEPKGQRFLLNITILPIVRDGRVTGSLIIIEDITEKRLREVKLRQAENLANLTNVAAGVAHEIKNPLASLSIHVQLIQKLLNNANGDSDGKDGGNVSVPYQKFNKHLTTITEEIERLNGIVVDFLFAVRPMEMLPVKSDINELIKEIIEFIHYEMKQTNTKCKLKLEKNIPLIEIDRRYIKQALLNLIQNAIEAMSGGGFLVIKTESSGEEITISIKDTGPGISDEDRAKIFEPYFTTKVKGTGLGLTLVFKIIREHRGEINLISEKDKGACFIIKLPLPHGTKPLLGSAA